MMSSDLTFITNEQGRTYNGKPWRYVLIPYWVFNGKGDFKIRRYIPALPLSRERAAAVRLRASLGAYRMVFGQPRQEDLLAFLQSSRGVTEQDASLYGIDLAPPRG